MEWHPIETAPKDRVILAAQGEWVFLGFWFELSLDRGTWASCDACVFAKPEYWAPIQTLPWAHGEFG
jgi:hypothetical protein